MKQMMALSLLLLLGALPGKAQVLINKGIYKANYSPKYYAPRYVSYYLYKGGGDCNRETEGFDFRHDMPEVECPSYDRDYRGTGYERGHLANAEDFAYDCSKEELTFRYYNCLPQTDDLNGRVWKKNEALIRQWSQTQKLYIICGGYFGSKKMGRVTVPGYCWKVVQAVKTKKVLFCGWFRNSETASVKVISVKELEEKLGARIVLLK